MVEKFWLLAPLLIFAAIPAYAQEAPPSLPPGGFEVNLFFVDSYTSEPLRERMVLAIYSANDTQEWVLRKTDGRGVIALIMDGGTYDLVGEINDRAASPGNDFFARKRLSIESSRNFTVQMMPVGTLIGTVLLDNYAVENARISLKCASSLYDMGEFYRNVKTDELGTFSLRNVPAESCEIFASYNGKSGRENIALQQGQLLRVDIRLEQKLSENPGPNYLEIILILFSFLVLGLVVYKKYFAEKKVHFRGVGNKGMETGEKKSVAADRKIIPKKINNKLESAEESGSGDIAGKGGKVRVNKKMDGIIRTLNENERKIIEFIIAQNGRSRQNRIYHALLIPKVSLSRAIFSLENKNIVKTRSLGKVKEVELSDWFLQ
ncbi:MAG: hypothetical protein ABIG96_02220 [Candidatus Micrarchaeota archaeon]